MILETFVILGMVPVGILLGVLFFLFGNDGDVESN